MHALDLYKIMCKTLDFLCFLCHVHTLVRSHSHNMHSIHLLANVSFIIRRGGQQTGS